jgi:DNA polymerase-3 subunit delta
MASAKSTANNYCSCIGGAIRVAIRAADLAVVHVAGIGCRRRGAYTRGVPELKPVYLIHGDDHGAIAERRARLRALAEADGDAASVEFLEGEQGIPAGVAMALCAMTMTIGRRVIVVDGVERWKPAEVERDLLGALAQMPPDTTLAMFAREEGRSKAPPELHKAVTEAGGQVVAEATIKPWELPKWVRSQAAGMGLQLDMAAAKALVGQVGERQQRLLRELEKLSLEVADTDGLHLIGADEVQARAARSSERRAFSLADALVGADAGAATRIYLSLRQQGERLPGLSYLMASRLREALSVSLRLQGGESAAEVKRGLRMPPRAAERFIADVQRSEPQRLRASLTALADLEVDTRGGDPVNMDRTGLSGLDEDTLAVRVITAIAA